MIYFLGKLEEKGIFFINYNKFSKELKQFQITQSL